jgi:hypothetical protein
MIHLCRSFESGNLIERNDGDSFSKFTLLQQLCRDNFIFNYNIIETTTGADFKSGSRLEVLLRQGE